MNEIPSLRKTIKENFEKRKESYPNLKYFVYDENIDSLSFNNQTISPAGYALSHTAPIFFMMTPQDIFEFLKNGLYFQSPKEVDKVKNMITTELVVTEEEEQLLKNFVHQYIKRLLIYSNNKALFTTENKNVDLMDFLANLLERHKVVEAIKTGIYPNSVAANIITGEYLKLIEQAPNEKNKGMSLIRLSPNENKSVFLDQDENIKFNENENNFGIAGFTSTVLIIISAITFGMYLALKLM